jgi:hypothetical protein
MDISVLPRVRRLAVTTLLVTTLLAQSSPAMAEFGSAKCSESSTIPRNCVSLANNKCHAVRFEESLGQNWKEMEEATKYTLKHVYSKKTILVAYRDDKDPKPDVRVEAAAYPMYKNILGWVECPENDTGKEAHPNRWCRGQVLRYNTHFRKLVDGPNVRPPEKRIERRRALACHEMGHTVGLQHPDTSGTKSCMVRGSLDAGTSLTPAEIKSINDHDPYKKPACCRGPRGG